MVAASLRDGVGVIIDLPDKVLLLCADPSRQAIQSTLSQLDAVGFATPCGRPLVRDPITTAADDDMDAALAAIEQDASPA
uniref:Uncharacterized protein n=1 Tax=Oryza punctata TaxID=4537 RepID=A0A0E0KP75_ORYPU